MSRCTGHCCDGFMTRYSPGEWARIKEAIENDYDEWIDDNGKTWSTNFDDGKDEVLYIANMLILKEGDANSPGIIDAESGLNDQHYYTCKYWDAGTGLCKEYQARPGMCRNYPRVKCNFDGCTYSND